MVWSEEKPTKLPVEAIREMIVNAHCHRSLTDESCIQVAIYDDRLEVTSPGGLYNGLTLEALMHGHSKLRNRTVANVFGQMGLVEAWGTGIQRIIKAAKEHGLPGPKFQAFDDMFRVELFRAPASDSSVVSGQDSNGTSAIPQPDSKGASVLSWQNIGGASEITQPDIGDDPAEHRRCSDRASTDTKALNETQQKILFLLSRNAQLSASKIAEQIQISRRNVEVNIRKLKERGILIRHGSPKNGHWEIVK